MKLNRMLAIVAMLSVPALAGVTVTQGASAPVYTDYTLNFDEPGTPTGPVAEDAWLGSHGISRFYGGAGPGQVDDWTGIYGPWVGTGQSFFGDWGVFMELNSGATEMSLQAWDPSGPPSPFGGGAAIYVFNEGAEVGSLFFQPAWGGAGDSWLDITTDGGDVFDEIRILGYGFSPTTFVDDMSWNVVPEPGTLALLGIAGIAMIRRK